MLIESETERASVNSPTPVMDDIQPILTNSIKHLPPLHAVLDLLSTGVCVRCVLRLFGVTGRIYSSPLLSPSSLLSAFQNTNHDLNVNDSYFCGICLGVLQFSYTTEGPEMSVKRYEITEFISSIAESIKRDGHEFGSFALEISVPQIILANERAIWVYLKRKYESESWFQEKLHSVHVSLKDALKQSMLSSLESLLDAKLGEGSVHIQMKYTDSKASSGIPESQEINQSFKRRKTGTEDNLNSVKVNGMACADFDYGEIGSVMHDNEQFKSPPERVKEPCHLTCHCYRTPLYIGGRYLKYSRNVSQTRWIIDEERKGEASVEEIIGNTILPFCRGDNYKFHAAGREDIDVRMLGSGRPFLIEVQNARHDPSNVKLLMAAMEEKINSSEVKLVRVKNVSVVGIEGWNLMREGETEKQKQYAALVWISRSLTDEDMQTISSFKDLKILQRTPVRVLHRRSPLDREKIIHWMKIEKIVGSTQYFLLHLCTQAGTYIKEFVHGDLGRTEPSVGSILGCRAEILQLDVTDVKMDCFN